MLSSESAQCTSKSRGRLVGFLNDPIPELRNEVPPVVLRKQRTSNFGHESTRSLQKSFLSRSSQRQSRHRFIVDDRAKASVPNVCQLRKSRRSSSEIGRASCR